MLPRFLPLLLFLLAAGCARGPEEPKEPAVFRLPAAPEPITSPSEANDEPGCFSPDGRYLFFTRLSRGAVGVWRLDLHTGEEERLADGQSPLLSLDGQAVLYEGDLGGVGVYSLETGSARLVEDLRPEPDPALPAAAWPVQFQHPGYVPAQLRELHPSFRRGVLTVRWSPDGHHGFLSATRPGGSPDPVTGQEPLTRHVVVVRKDEGGQYETLHELDTPLYRPALPDQVAWSADARRLYFSGWPAGAPAAEEAGRRVYALDVETGEAVPVSDGPADMLPAPSPDGRWLAYTRIELEEGEPRPRSRVVVSRPDGSDERLVEGLELNQPAWSPDSRFLVAAGAGEEASPLWIVPAAAFLSPGELARRY